jgi:hypothetical protein
MIPVQVFCINAERRISRAEDCGLNQADGTVVMTIDGRKENRGPVFGLAKYLQQRLYLK